MRVCAGLLGAIVLCAAPPVSFEREVQPILAGRCQMCHGDRNPSGKLSLVTGAALLRGGVSGLAIHPGDPDGSLLLRSIRGDKPLMPKAGSPLTADQVATIERWIREGAKLDSTASAKGKLWWSLAPLQKSAAAAGPSPIDGFILSRLREAHLEPSPEADRRTLIRRLSYDLLGLPPTSAETEAFVKDQASGAYERLVDRLLASPRYGERSARQWMDVIHYGESHGYDKDKPRLNAWPFRDWLISAFNQDMPYARFIQQQIAGDVLFPDDPQALVATGFLAGGPWDFVGHQELKEGTSDKDLTRVLDRDDMVATTMSAFTSTTAHCARCHDHKFDPIPQQEYYNLQSVFAGVDRADQPFDDDPAVYASRRKLQGEKRAVQLRLQPLLDKVEFATSPEIERLTDSIQDAQLLLAHMGEPKTPAEAAAKKELEARRDADRKRRQELVDVIAGAETFAAIALMREELKALDAKTDVLPKPRLVYSSSGYFPRAGNFRPSLTPRPVFVLDRGNVRAPRQPATPGALSAVSMLAARFDLPDAQDEGSRRAALARWISDRDNVLTWRSIVNRVWQSHFGAGLVDTANDFGRMGSQPTHPELLDWLALWFRDDAQGSLKRLHRLIVTSAVYRQSSAHREDAARIDGENRLLWRMNRTRLDAEQLRDAVLAAAGKLDLSMGGPSVQMFRFKDDHSPVYDYASFDPDSPGAYRRSIYRFIVRSVPDPFMDRLDCPDPSVLTPKRSTTLTAIQALAVWNNAFVLRMSQHLAERARHIDDTLPGQVSEAIQLVLGRKPSAEELTAYTAYARQHGLPNLGRVLFNTNEFVFVD